MENKKSKSQNSAEKSGMSRSHSSTSSICSIPRLPPIDSVASKTILETPKEEASSRLSRLLEIGKYDIALAANSVVEQARLAEKQMTSRMDNLSHEVHNAVERVMREKESELLEVRVRCEEADSRTASLMDRERGLVEQQSQLSIELVMERRGKQAAVTELGSLKKSVDELKGKLDALELREKGNEDKEVKAESDWSVKVRESKEEISNLKSELEEERELRKRDRESSKQETNDKHCKESMRLHQEVNKWKLKCEKSLEETRNIKKEAKSKEEELRQERVSKEEKSKHESGQYKSALKALEEKMQELNDSREEEKESLNGVIERMQSDMEALKKKYGDALRQIEMLKRSLEEYENPEENVMESYRLRLLRVQNQREKAKLDADRREVIRLKNLAASK